MLDTSIAMGVKPIQAETPLNQLAQFLQVQQSQQANKLYAQKADEYQRGVEDQNRLRALTEGWGADTTDEQRSADLKRGGFFDKADLVEKNSIARKNAMSEGQARKAKALTDFMSVQKDLAGAVMANPTLENAMAALNRVAGYHKDLGFGDMDVTQELASLRAMSSPEQIKQWAAGHAINAEKLLPSTRTVNAGDAHVSQSVDPVTGKVTDTGRTVIGQSADNKATNATSRANNAATVAATIRGQDLVNARAGETLAFEKTKEANKAANDKALTEGQSKALLFGSRMQNAHDILSQLAEKGVNTSTIGSQAGYGVGGAVNFLSNADQQSLEQAKRDFVNAVLRRESGASISTGEFDSANKQYFPQIGDSKQVIAQKAKAREIAIRGMQAEIPENRREGLVNKVLGKSSTVDSLLEKYK